MSNALGDNIKTKGANSYYYAHASTSTRSESELQEILADIKQLEENCETSYSKRLLQREKSKTEEELKNAKVQAQLEKQRTEDQLRFQRQQQEARSKAAAGDATTTTEASCSGAAATSSIMYSQVASYAWDQSDKFASVYITCSGVGQEPAERIKCNFGDFSFHLTLDLDKAGGNSPRQQQLKIPNLNKKIDVGKSKMIIKADRLVIKLKKAEVGVEWSALDDTEDKKKAQRDKRVKTGDLKGASTQELLADMYANADDETRKGLMEAAAKGQAKREAREKDIKSGNSPKPIQSYGSD
jgi:hypothetical protein